MYMIQYRHAALIGVLKRRESNSIVGYGESGDMTSKADTMVGTSSRPGLLPRMADHLVDFLQRSR